MAASVINEIVVAGNDFIITNHSDKHVRNLQLVIANPDREAPVAAIIIEAINGSIDAKPRVVLRDKSRIPELQRGATNSFMAFQDSLEGRFLSALGGHAQDIAELKRHFDTSKFSEKAKERALNAVTAALAEELRTSYALFNTSYDDLQNGGLITPAMKGAMEAFKQVVVASGDITDKLPAQQRALLAPVLKELGVSAGRAA